MIQQIIRKQEQYLRIILTILVSIITLFSLVLGQGVSEKIGDDKDCLMFISGSLDTSNWKLAPRHLILDTLFYDENDIDVCQTFDINFDGKNDWLINLFNDYSQTFITKLFLSNNTNSYEVLDLKHSMSTNYDWVDFYKPVKYGQKIYLKSYLATQYPSEGSNVYNIDTLMLKDGMLIPKTKNELELQLLSFDFEIYDPLGKVYLSVYCDDLVSQNVRIKKYSNNEKNYELKLTSDQESFILSLLKRQRSLKFSELYEYRRQTVIATTKAVFRIKFKEEVYEMNYSNFDPYIQRIFHEFFLQM